ncbi:mechanosensitive ion channel family protein [Streptococcus himalayensis]|uniref:Mechanosensitive ion channel protein n=1 Tax=Streptococcus himalayensis TaxID=1888195 RepID=A0A917ED50_9STRE|nr:mechanosensitive ion channel family protein [Streptococcus himalayensis]GGE25993.1 mechanosensitive ion channel protein [Streptococcus himalayensis]
MKEIASNLFSRYVEKLNWVTLVDELFDKFVSLVFLFLLFYIAKKLLHVAVTRILTPSFRLSSHDEARQKTLVRLIENSLNYVLYFLLIYWILSILGLPVSSLLAGAGIAGVAIGMGAQGFLSDLVNGFFILLERQLDVGDSVRLTNGSIKIAGTVVSVGIRTTQVRDSDGTLHFVPNRNITVVSNLSRGDMRVVIDLPLSTQTDLDKVYQVIAEVNSKEVAKYREILTEPNLLGPQMDIAGRFSFRVTMTVQSGMQTTIYHEFYRLYYEALLEEGIELLTAGSKS